MLELSLKGSKTIKVGDQERKFIQDNDEVTLFGKQIFVARNTSVFRLLPKRRRSSRIWRMSWKSSAGFQAMKTMHNIRIEFLLLSAEFTK
jgi:hypothetical protein